MNEDGERPQAAAGYPPVRLDGADIGGRLRILGRVIAVDEDAQSGAVTVTLRTGPIDHTLAIDPADGEAKRVANAFVYAAEGDRFSLDVCGENAQFTIESPEGRVFKERSGPQADTVFAPRPAIDHHESGE